MKEAKDILCGKIVTRIAFEKEMHSTDVIESVEICCDDGSRFIIDHEQSCCEHVFLETHTPIPELPFIISEIVESSIVSDADYDVEEITAQSFATDKGAFVLLWRGTSNGYYGMSVAIRMTDENGYNPQVYIKDALETTIQGKYNSATVFTTNIEDTAREQIKTLCDQEAFAGAQIRIMPDVHAGKGCTIGTTMTITDKICPSMVGVDIGCGMDVVNLGKIKNSINLDMFDRFIRKNIPSGFGIREFAIPLAKQSIKLENLLCADVVNIDRAYKSIGTLGGGNHFIELDTDNDGNVYLVIHSGSRNLGKQIAEHYQNIAEKETNSGGDRRKEIISILKEQGRESEIEETIKAEHFTVIDKDLCYLTGQSMDNYLNDMVIAQYFASLNRKFMSLLIKDYLGLVTNHQQFETVHNYIDMFSRILRKGAVSAKKGERLIIPMNMRDGSLLCIGKGNIDWNCSAPHGAGRIMSRKKAKETLSMQEFHREMDGIYSTSIDDGTIDESPMAYKPMAEIIKNIGETVEVVKVIKPIYNFKASDSVDN